MDLNELIKEYSDELYSKFPLFYEYLETINGFANELLNVSEDLEDEILKETEYKYEIGFIDLEEICEEILSSIGTSLAVKFRQGLIDGTVSFDDELNIGFSSMCVDDKKINIEIDRRYNIDDILGLIHEFFHSIHIEKFDNDLYNEQWYVFTETVALTGELYGLIYMYQHDILKEDVISYTKRLMASILTHADTALLTGLTLDIYDKEQTISWESITHYIELKKMPEDYKNLGYLLEELEDFEFHISATYVLGFPIAVLLASKMIDDSVFSRKIVEVLNHINDYPLINLLNYLGMDDLVKNESYVCLAMNYIYELVSHMIKEKELDIKRLLVEMR